MKRREQRTRIIFGLYQYLLTQKSLDDILQDNVSTKDEESISYIVNNIVEVINNIDNLIATIEPKLNDYQFERLGYIEQAILLLSTYQLGLHEYDKAVVINEAIEIAKKYCDEDAPKFINGVLDQL